MAADAWEGHGDEGRVERAGGEGMKETAEHRTGVKEHDNRGIGGN